MNQDLMEFLVEIIYGAYVINLDEYHDIGTHWVAFYVNNKVAIYFDSFGVEHIPKESMKFIVRTSFGLGSRRKKNNYKYL